MELEKARTIAQSFIERNINQFERAEVCGSIRRGKPDVNDIDIVIIPKDPENLLRDFITTKHGAKYIQIPWEGFGEKIDIDVYVSNQADFEVHRLIRTGSRDHNVKLCRLAIGKGWRLRANGVGLITPSEIFKTENGILIMLLGRYVRPEERL